MDNLYIVMPAYNEAENIEKVVLEWYPTLQGKGAESKLVIADSGSSDNTHEILLKLKEEMPQLEILDGTLKQHGPKLIALYKYAISQGADYVFQTDSDGQTVAFEFNAFWEMRDSYDAIIGNRPIREDGQSRAFIEKVVCILLRIFFGVKVSDANAPFRLMKSELVEKYVGRFAADYDLPNIMLVAWFKHYSENIAFKDITFRQRQAGINSVNIPSVVRTGKKALVDFYKFKKDLKL